MRGPNIIMIDYTTENSLGVPSSPDSRISMSAAAHVMRIERDGMTTGMPLESPGLAAERLFASAAISGALAPSLHAVRSHSIFWLRAALLSAFLMIGMFGRDPWKADEPYSVGMVLNFFRGYDLIVPHVAGDPFVEKPPLMYWTGALSARLFSGELPIFDGAQIAVLVWTLVAAACVGLLAQRVYRKSTFDWLAPVLMLGSLGAIENVHKLTADVPQMAGAAIALAALTRLARDDSSAWRCGLKVGTGAGIAFLSKGLLVPGVLGLTCLAAGLLPAYRKRHYVVALAWAFLAALPWVVVWPALLWHASPALFTEWLWDNNFGRFLGSTHLGGLRSSYLNDFADLAALTFPSGWLALGALITTLRTGNWRRYAAAHPDLMVLWLYVALLIVTLESSQAIRDIYLLPLFPALAVLGTAARLPRWLEKTWSTFAIATASALGLIIWLHWGLQVSSDGHIAAGWVGKWLPLDYRLGFSPSLVLAALLVFALWIMAIVRRRELGALMTGFAGLTFVWGTLLTLLLPWINEARSYREPFSQMRNALPEATLRGESDACLVSYAVGESERAMLDYFIDVRPVWLHQLSQPSSCRLMLVLDKAGQRVDLPAGWQPIWHGGRAGDHNERFTLLFKPA